MPNTVVLTRDEVDRLWSVMSSHQIRLTSTGDYPEEKDDDRLVKKILDIKFMCDRYLGHNRDRVYVVMDE